MLRIFFTTVIKHAKFVFVQFQVIAQLVVPYINCLDRLQKVLDLATIDLVKLNSICLSFFINSVAINSFFYFCLYRLINLLCLTLIKIKQCIQLHRLLLENN